VNLRNEPEGWHRLKAAAQRATDAQSLALIIDEMNRILDQHQKTVNQHQKTVNDETEHLLDSRAGRPVIGVEVLASRYD
jgi:uncharacterized coiled-coil protein SlyX